MEKRSFTPENTSDRSQVLYNNVQSSPIELRNAIATAYQKRVNL